jgi:hypothetical protein
MAVPFTLVLVTDGDDMETILHRLLLIGCLLTPVTAHAVELTVGPRLEITHPGKGHEIQLSGPAVAVDREGGVTARIDFGLQVAARLRSEQYVQMLQLMLEYDPQPPFHAGSPEGAGEKLTNHARSMRSPAVEAARKAALEAQKRLQG